MGADDQHTGTALERLASKADQLEERADFSRASRDLADLAHAVVAALYEASGKEPQAEEPTPGPAPEPEPAATEGATPESSA